MNMNYLIDNLMLLKPEQLLFLGFYSRAGLDFKQLQVTSSENGFSFKLDCSIRDFLKIAGCWIASAPTSDHCSRFSDDICTLFDQVCFLREDEDLNIPVISDHCSRFSDDICTFLDQACVSINDRDPHIPVII
jgi:hypothetical protein